MKKLVLPLLLLISIASYSQSDNSSAQKNRTEVKFNVFSTFLGAVDFEFERTLNNHSSVGMSFRQSFEKSEHNEIAVFYRKYLGKKYASGFFIEGFGMYHSKYYYVSTISKNEDIFRFSHNSALGLGIGYKLISKKGLILQTHIGAGRKLINGKADNGDRGESYLGKIGISIGFSF